MPRIPRLGVALAALSVLAACGTTPAAPAMSEQEAMEKMIALATPGAPHELLASHAGHWKQSFRIRWSPDQPWQESSGSADGQVLLGGRFVLEHSTFTIADMPVEGYMLLGYDNLRGEYTSLWMDSLGTWWVESRGQQQPDGAIAYAGTLRDMTGERPFRMVTRHEPDGSFVTEMFDTIDGQELQVMTIVARR